MREFVVHGGIVQGIAKITIIIITFAYLSTAMQNPLTTSVLEGAIQHIYSLHEDMTNPLWCQVPIINYRKSLVSR